MLRRLFLVLIVLLVACNSDDTTGPAVETGTILIDADPDGMGISWTLQRPGGGVVTGTEDMTYANQEPGEYKITWDDVDGLLTPFPQTIHANLSAGEEHTFLGTYWNDGPTVCIEVSFSAGVVGEEFTFDGSCSGDNEDPNEFLTFAWDWEGDGTIDETVQGDDEITHTFNEIGLYGTTLHLTDRGGVANEDSRPIWVGPVGFIPIYTGFFFMGAAEDEPGAGGDEYPNHDVTMMEIFFMQELEVTNQEYADMAQWAVESGLATATTSSLMDNLDGSTAELLDLDAPLCEISYDGVDFTTDHPDHPVKLVTWYGAAAYCDWLSLQEGEVRLYDHGTWTCNSFVDPGYRLPTEAEWEYTCRAGSSTEFGNGSMIDIIDNDTCLNDPVLDEIGWYCDNSGGTTQPVGLKIANDWGFKDMHGNVMEWCNDYYSSDYYDNSPRPNPLGPFYGTTRVLRGGDFSVKTHFCRSANRNNANPSAAESNIGFRVVRMVSNSER